MEENKFSESEITNYSNKSASGCYPYAGFWRRTLAFLIDIFLLLNLGGIVSVLISFALFGSVEDEVLPWVEICVLPICFILYNALMESSSAKQATLGKMALGIKVVDNRGERIGFGRAIGRVFGKWVSSATLYFGFLMASYTSRKQSLHDIITATYVVNKNFKPGEELPADKWSTASLVFSILAIIGIFIGPWLFVALGVTIFGAGSGWV